MELGPPHLKILFSASLSFPQEQVLYNEQLRGLSQAVSPLSARLGASHRRGRSGDGGSPPAGQNIPGRL